MKKLFLTLLISSLFFFQCRDTAQKDETYKSSMLKNLNAFVEKNYTELVSNANKLNVSIKDYVSNGSVTKLKTVQENWHTYIKTWSKVKAFNVQDVKYNLLHTFIYSKPDAPKIEQNILNKPNISSSEVASLGADQKGINAIEYLLFKETDLAKTDSAFNYYPNFESRKNFLSKLSEELLMQTSDLEKNWRKEYNKKFLNNNKLDVSAPLSEVFNNGIEIITIALKDLNQNLADNSFETFGYFSHSDTKQLKHSLNALKELFDIEGKECFSAYLEQKTDSKELSQKVNAAFDDIINETSFFEQAYKEMSTSQKEDLKARLKNLSALFSINVSSELLITVTLSDTDGD